MSDSGARWGEQELKGTKLAIEQTQNKKESNNYQIKLLVEDFTDDKMLAGSAYHKLSQNGVKFILGPTWNQGFLAITPLSEQDKNIVISASVTQVPHNLKYAFSTWPSDQLAAKLIAERIYKDGNMTLGIIGIQTDWGTNLTGLVKKNFQELGGKVVYSTFVSDNEKDLRTQIATLKEQNPDVIYLASNIITMSSYFNQAKNLNYSPPIYGTDSTEDPELLELSGKLADGIIYMVPKEARNQSFIKAFNEKLWATASYLCR